MMKRIRIDWAELEDTFCDGSDEHRYYLDRDTGAVHFFSAYLDNKEEEEDEHQMTSEERYVLIPHARRVVPMRQIRDFIASLENSDQRRVLQSTIIESEDERRFEDVIDDLPDALHKWKRFHRDHLEERIKNWLTEVGVEPLE